VIVETVVNNKVVPVAVGITKAGKEVKVDMVAEDLAVPVTIVRKLIIKSGTATRRKEMRVACWVKDPSKKTSGGQGSDQQQRGPSQITKAGEEAKWT
jgi:hypothetical protein